MLIGLIGAPNKGKSTIFSAMTSVDVQIADYAFTTIKPNVGVAYATKECAEVGLKVRCNPRNSTCKNGVRHIPINVIDVAGLVPDAHLGKGMGNQFLNDLISADALVQIVDLSGKTGISGNAVDSSDPYLEVEMIRDELSEWLAEILLKHMPKLSKRADGDVALHEILAGFKADIEMIRRAAEKNHLTLSSINWSKTKCREFALSLLEENKPIIIAANKADKAEKGALERLMGKANGIEVVECSGAIELALVKAANRGIIDYEQGANDFTMLGDVSGEQRDALAYMKSYIKEHNGTGVQRLLNSAVFKVLKNIVVYPVEDETHFSDHSGNVLPDALLMRKGSTAYDMAMKIHTDIAKGMKYAVDARKKVRLQKEYVLNDNDVIKIVSMSK